MCRIRAMHSAAHHLLGAARLRTVLRVQAQRRPGDRWLARVIATRPWLVGMGVRVLQEDPVRIFWEDEQAAIRANGDRTHERLLQAPVHGSQMHG